jgi:uncharacterized FlaG/YvyC family protein
MNESTINSVSSTQPVSGGAIVRLQSGPGPAAQAAQQVQVAQQSQVKATQQAAQQDQAAAPAPANDKPVMTNTADFALRFRVDEETRQVTVFVIDKASRRVLRTVPPEEFSKLKAGDLFELTA